MNAEINYRFLHLLCFISNVYKQRFFQGVKILEKLSNSTPWFQIVKQLLEISQAMVNPDFLKQAHYVFFSSL